MIDKSVYYRLNNSSHEGEARMEGAARRGFFIELEKMEKRKKSIAVMDGQETPSPFSRSIDETDPRNYHKLKRVSYGPGTRDTDTFFIGGNHV